MKDISIPGGRNAEKAAKLIRVFSPVAGTDLPDTYPVSDTDDVDRTARQAAGAASHLAATSGTQRAAFLEEVGREILAIGDHLIERAMAETGLPESRLVGERGRTIHQLNQFAALVREGSWVDAIIDPAEPDRKPTPKPDLRQMLRPLGPVAVFGAGNFPLAFSTAGGDTASALAAGCPVVFKAHEGHLGTHVLIARAIRQAVERSGMPDHTFQYVVGDGYQTGQELVRHPTIRAAGFTGSFTGGRALWEIANRRETPIPFFAEMGSINPVVILPEALRTRAEVIGQQLVWSFTLNAGQFCTNPGLIILREGPGLDLLIPAMQQAVASRGAERMYGPHIHSGFEDKAGQALEAHGVTLIGRGLEGETLDASAVLARVNATDFLAHPHLHREIFGPFSLLVVCPDDDAFRQVINSLEGQLTLTLMAEDRDLASWGEMIPGLSGKCGRLIWNGVPTGVEVSPAMHHGGPWPATTDSRFTSVGTQAIRRWVRPVCFQNLPDAALPPELQKANPLGIWRQIGGTWTQDPG